ncbi:outer membrane beta-barrel protein [uncultured Psychroserpens sp.]|uniref:outer membrane beta-barrel protein n=1 Tax=uncultured Psychroserpens sp. TaxID=255436 RepID=UPI002635FF13|nr:outer membrane beta-barrel protein [uncultured Psychroserpens sp.]
MKITWITYILFSLSLCVFSQELRPMPLDFETMMTNVDFNFEEPITSKEVSFFQLGTDLYNLQVLSFTKDEFSLSINTRLEEELPYEDNRYDYTGFYYLDFGISYAIKRLSFSLSVENIFNQDNDSFSIDPIVESSNGIIDNYYFSHETDALISFGISYNF